MRHYQLSLLLFGLMLLSLSGFGQAPGYLGHNQMIGGGVFFAPRGLIRTECTPNWAGEYKCLNGDSVSLGMHLTATLAWEKILNRNTTLTLSGEAYGTGGKSNFLIGTEEKELYSRITSLSAAVGMKSHLFHFNGTIAPYGAYYSLQFRLGVLTERRYDQDTVAAAENNLGMAIAPGAYGGLGYHCIFGENLVMDIGMRAGTFFPMEINTLRTNGGLFKDALGLEFFRFYLRFYLLI